MKTLLWWMEPVGQARRTVRSRLVDFAVSFGASAVMGLGIAAKAGSMVEIQIGGGTSLSVPAHGWQYGLWLLIGLAGGCVGWWIVSLAGRAEVNLRDDGILEQRRWSAAFYPYGLMDACEIVPSPHGAYLLLRIHARRGSRDGPLVIRELGISRRVTPDRIRAILRSKGVAVTGAEAA